MRRKGTLYDWQEDEVFWYILILEQTNYCRKVMGGIIESPLYKNPVTVQESIQSSLNLGSSQFFVNKGIVYRKYGNRNWKQTQEQRNP